MNVQENGARAPKSKKSLPVLTEAPAAATNVTGGALQRIAVALVDESALNPRKHFDEAKLEELAADIRRRGLLQPVLCRPSPAGDGRFELVFGARRLRGAKLAGLTEVLAFVHALTDEEVLELQLVENAKRADITPLEEAAALLELYEKHRHSVADLARKLSKSQGHVLGRLALAQAAPAVRKSLDEGKLLLGVALLIARLPDHKLQSDAVCDLEKHGDWDDMCSIEAAKSDLAKYMCVLDKASFDREDLLLVPDAGACSACPKRTGAQAELFEAKTHDLCTDPACFKAKQDAAWIIRRSKAEGSGQRVLDDAEAARVFKNHGGHAAGGFVALDEEFWRDGGSSAGRKKLVDILGAKATKKLATVVARDQSGNARELVKREDLHALPADVVKKLPYDLRPESKLSGRGATPARDSSAAKFKEQEERRKREAAAKRAKTFAIVAAVVAKAEAKLPPANFWPFLARLLAREAGYDASTEILKRRGLAKDKKNSGHGHDYRKALEQLVDDKKPDAARALVVELAMGAGAWAFGSWCSKAVDESVLAAAEFYGVDAARIGAAAVKEAKASKTQRPAKRGRKP